MNRRKTIRRRWHFWRLAGRQGNRRVRVKAKEPAPPRDFRCLLQVILRGAKLVGKVTAVAAVLGLVSYGGYASYRALAATTYFDVRQIVIEAARRAPAEELEQLVASAKGRNIFALDLSALRRAVQSHPWVKEARLQRQLPHTLRVHVTEHKAQALVLMGHPYLVSAEGQVFKRADTEEQVALPVITGISRRLYLEQREQATQQILRALRMLDQYYSKVRPPLSEVHFDDEGLITLFLRQGAVALRVGQELNEERLTTMDTVWAALGPEASRARVLYLDNETRRDRVTVRMASYQ